MSKAIGLQTRKELIRAVGERYRASSKDEKLKILNEFVAVTGYHRKHSIRLLNTEGSLRQLSSRVRRCVYDEATRQVIIALWEAADRVCGKRLKALIPVLLPALERHGHLKLDAVVREKVVTVSATTLDRLLREPRLSTSGRARRRASATTGVRRQVPIRTFADWSATQLPGFMEADLVAHSGESVAGSFVHTLVLTDIATGWTECVPIVVRESTQIIEALGCLRTSMPFALRGLDTDNGTEFLNESLIAFCAEHKIEFTRSRPYRKNDQAWVEQKNGSVVRRLCGYRRLEGLAASAALSRLYSASRLFINFFQPSFKLAEKRREGARVKKRYHAPETPCARLLANEAIAEPTKERLRAALATLDPLRLLDEIRTMQHHIVGLASGETLHVVPHRDADLEQFMRSLATAWRSGEVRPTHQKEPSPQRYWRTRKDPFESVWPQVRLWLEAEPDRTAKELLERLQREHPGSFPDNLVRTLQRRTKEWRQAAARKLLFATTTTYDVGQDSTRD